MISWQYRAFAAGLAVTTAACTPIGNAAPPRVDHQEGVARPVYQPMLVVPMPDLADGPVDGRPMESMQARDTPIGDVLLTLFRDSDINLVVDPAVQATECTFDIKHSTVEQAFEALLQSADLGYEWDGDYLRVTARVHDTLYVDLMTAQGGGDSGGGGQGGGSGGQSGGGEQDFWSTLGEVLPQIVGDNASAVVNRAASTIHVEARPSQIARLRELVDTTMRRANRQVSLEARVLEVRLDDAYNLGVNWSLLPHLFNSNKVGLAAGGAVAAQTAASGGSALSFGVLDTGDFSAFVDALQHQGEVRVLSSPRVATMNNQAANIAVTDQVPYITREVIDDQGVARTEYGVEFVDTGVSLQVRPMIGEDGILTVAITPSVREQTGKVVTPDGLIEVPIVSERTATTLVRVSDGQAIALGGLRSTRKDETRQGVPFLMNIPLLGQLFSSTVQSRTEVELMILLSPRVLDDTWIREEVRRGEHRLLQLRRGFQLNSIGLEGCRREDWAGGSMQGDSMAATGPALRLLGGPPQGLDEDHGLTVTRRGLAAHRLDRAQRALDDSRVREARNDIDQALQLDPHNATALVAAGILHAREGDVARARSLLDHALARASDDPLALTARGALELAHGSAHSARRYLERAHALLGTAMTAANLGAALLALDEDAAACALLRGVGPDGVPAELHANLACAELELGEIAAARASLGQALAKGIDARNPRIVALDKLIALAEQEAAAAARSVR
jgi:MSHA biogenesis protein MshL